MDSEEALILVKAMPRPSQKYGETVCCAGVTAERKWRRLYPIRFRQLGDNNFNRWQWVRYNCRLPRSDLRQESRFVFEDSLAPGRKMPERERAGFLDSLLVESVARAADQGDSLALIRPIQTKFRWRRKSPTMISKEKSLYKTAASQTSFFDQELAAIEPSPFEFRLKFLDTEGWHHHSCSDWETTAAFWQLSRKYGADKALDHLNGMYNVRYPEKGMALALGTMAKRPRTWLLLGIIRLDPMANARLIP